MAESKESQSSHNGGALLAFLRALKKGSTKNVAVIIAISQESKPTSIERCTNAVMKSEVDRGIVQDLDVLVSGQTVRKPVCKIIIFNKANAREVKSMIVRMVRKDQTNKVRVFEKMSVIANKKILTMSNITTDIIASLSVVSSVSNADSETESVSLVANLDTAEQLLPEYRNKIDKKAVEDNKEEIPIEDKRYISISRYKINKDYNLIDELPISNKEENKK